MADIGGETSFSSFVLINKLGFAWLGIANTLALAATAPFAGAVSDLIGRRYVALLGALLIIVGMIIVGTAHRMDVAIGGMSIEGVGAGLAELISLAGVAELAPVKSRGKYTGIIFLLILPFAASAGYGSLSLLLSADFSSAVILSIQYVEMGCLDTDHSYRRNFRATVSLLLASTSCKFSRSHQVANSRPN